MIIPGVLAVLAGVMAGQFRHVVGAAPLLAALLSAACVLRRRDVILVGLGAVVVRDALAGMDVFTLVRLASVLVVGGVIGLLRVRLAARSLLVGLAVTGPVYHLMLATGDWALQYCTVAPHTAAGWLATVATSLPYVQRSLLGELLVTGLFLGGYLLVGYALAQRWPAALATAPRR